MPVKFRLKEVMQEYEQRTGEKVTFRSLSQATGISTNTLYKMATNTQTMVGLDVLDRLCNFFQCNLNDLIQHI